MRVCVPGGKGVRLAGRVWVCWGSWSVWMDGWMGGWILQRCLPTYLLACLPTYLPTRYLFIYPFIHPHPNTKVNGSRAVDLPGGIGWLVYGVWSIVYGLWFMV